MASRSISQNAGRSCVVWFKRFMILASLLAAELCTDRFDRFDRFGRSGLRIAFNGNRERNLHSHVRGVRTVHSLSRGGDCSDEFRAILFILTILLIVELSESDNSALYHMLQYIYIFA
jgi:hypothetical protein